VAEARGIDATIAASPLPEIAALADAARYTGRNDLARRALLAERSRFPGSPEARSAAFLLGRMAEAGSPAAAIDWYDRYLASRRPARWPRRRSGERPGSRAPA